MEILPPFLMAAGETKAFERAGRYFEVIDAQYGLSVNFYDEGGQKSDMKNVMSGIYSEEPYTRFQIINGSNPQVVQLMLSESRGGSRRQPGVVRVVDDAKATTLAAAAYIGSGSNVKTAALYGTVQLWNPAGSGKRLIVESFTVNNSEAANNIWIAGYGAAGTQYASGAFGSHANKLVGGAASVVVVNQKSDHAGDPSALLTQGILYGGTLGASGTVTVTPKRPLIVLPGQGLIVGDRTVNSAIGVAWEFYEEATT